MIEKSPNEYSKREVKPINQNGLAKDPNKKMPSFFTSEDYVSLADKFMSEFKTTSKRNKKVEVGKVDYGDLTSSQVRNLFALVTRVYNKILAGGIVTPADIGSIKVRMVYEAGRKQDVKNFLAGSELLKGLDYIHSNKDQFLRYARYMEALVAYHYFYSSSKD